MYKLGAVDLLKVDKICFFGLFLRTSCSLNHTVYKPLVSRATFCTHDLFKTIGAKNSKKLTINGDWFARLWLTETSRSSVYGLPSPLVLLLTQSSMVTSSFLIRWSGIWHNIPRSTKGCDWKVYLWCALPAQGYIPYSTKIYFLLISNLAMYKGKHVVEWKLPVQVSNYQLECEQLREALEEEQDTKTELQRLIRWVRNHIHIVQSPEWHLP